MYSFWYWLHVTSVYLSLSGFILRGIWMLKDSPLRRKLVVRTLPHVIDTLLFIGAAGLALTLMQYPFVHGWLTAKLFALLAYISLGLVAFRFGLTRRVRAMAFGTALLAFGYLLSVAYTRDPLPIF